MKIGIISAMEKEILPLIEKIEDKTCSKEVMLNVYEGKYCGVEVVAGFAGICKVNAAILTQILISKYDVTHVIMAGVAGGLSNKLSVKDIVISTELAYHDVKPSILIESHPCMEDEFFRADEKMVKDFIEAAEKLPKSNNCFAGRIITGEVFVDEKIREDLIQRYQPLCVDMESASVAHTCHVNEIPFVIIRSISDLADENGTETFYENVNVAAVKTLDLVDIVLKKYSEL